MRRAGARGCSTGPRALPRHNMPDNELTFDRLPPLLVQLFLRSGPVISARIEHTTPERLQQMLAPTFDGRICFRAGLSDDNEDIVDFAADAVAGYTIQRFKLTPTLTGRGPQG